MRTLKKGQGTKTFLATDLSQDSRVVVKAVSAAHFSTGTRMRLEHEATLLRQVRSRWLAPLSEVLQDDGTLYLVAPYVEGVSLQERLADKSLNVPETLSLGCCLLSALKDIHEHRVLHRDIKPTSIIVDDHLPLTSATLVDFGPARSAASQLPLRRQSTESVLYMSPEQTGSIDHDVGEPADLYSAGVLLFECLAGHPPFRGDTVGNALFEHMTVPVPDLRSLRREIPRALDEVIQRLLRKDPRDRYQTAGAVLADLEAIADALRCGERDPSLVVGSM
ncbi:MAG TPA: serine/threonine-protein kinase, partial [Thermoguttaceae bacterium]|nr:serine/threonine-protein kinase [Thermoguttaceae bacterium]